VAVTAAYTNQPLPLKDGLAQHFTINSHEPKYFKYPIYIHDNITATILNNYGAKIQLYCKLITSEDKFMYPDKEDYNGNST
jgi:hypothetical protein